DLGIGAGWYEEEFEPFGYAYPPTGERFAILEESVAVVAGLFGEGPFDHQGTRFRLHGAFNRPRPVPSADGSTGPPIGSGGDAGRGARRRRPGGLRPRHLDGHAGGMPGPTGLVRPTGGGGVHRRSRVRPLLRV